MDWDFSYLDLSDAQGQDVNDLGIIANINSAAAAFLGLNEYALRDYGSSKTMLRGGKYIPGKGVIDNVKLTRAAKIQSFTYAKYAKGAGQFLGVVSMADHGMKFYDSYNNGDWSGMALNGAKLLVDGFLMFNKIANPAVLIGSVIYNVADASGVLDKSFWE